MRHRFKRTCKMPFYLKKSYLKQQVLTPALLGGAILLGGCQHTLKAPVLTTLPAPNSASTDNPAVVQPVVSPVQFSVTGKIGVRTPKQNGSAFYAWTQVNDRFAIELTGALGIGQTYIEGVPGQVSLTSAKTGLIQAETPEELLERATGWQTPISYLVYWIEAKPAEASAQAQYDADNRLSILDEGGWHVLFSYNEKEKLPQKLVMSQPTVDASNKTGENRVTLTVQTRTDAAQR